MLLLLLALVDAMRTWDSHVLKCAQCRTYDTADTWSVSASAGPCKVGNVIIHSLLTVLKKRGG